MVIYKVEQHREQRRSGEGNGVVVGLSGIPWYESQTAPKIHTQILMVTTNMKRTAPISRRSFGWARKERMLREENMVVTTSIRITSSTVPNADSMGC